MNLGPWIPAIAAVLAALVAGLFAWRANQATLANQRILELEKRLATQRLDVYKPLMQAMASYLSYAQFTPREQKQQNERLMAALKEAALWIPVYGSDATVRAFHRVMQIAYADAPPPIMLRAYGQLMLAIRRDLAEANSELDLVDLLGIRITDVYEKGMAEDLRLSDDAYYRKHNWTPPWRE